MVGDDEIEESQVEYYIDEENFEEIVDFIKDKRDKTKRILYEIKKNRFNDRLYEKIQGTRDLTAFRYQGKDNFRIYCRDYTEGTRRIILMVLHHKKNTKFRKKETTIIKTITNYYYDLKSK